MRKIKAAFTKKVLTAIVIIGVLAILLMYMLVYMKYSDKTIELQRTNSELKNTISELRVYYDNQAKYEADIAVIREVVERLLGDYPADVRPEDVVMLSVELQENSQIVYSNINMSENELVYEVPQEVVMGAGYEGLDEKITFMRKRASLVNLTNYDNLKECIEQIYKNPNRIGIENIAYIKNNEEDILEGSIDLIFYYATGTDKEYVCPDIEEYLMGTKNIFQ